MFEFDLESRETIRTIDVAPDTEWSNYERRPILLRRGQPLEYRAIDDAWNSSPVQAYTIDD